MLCWVEEVDVEVNKHIVKLGDLVGYMTEELFTLVGLILICS